MRKRPQTLRRPRRRRRPRRPRRRGPASVVAGGDHLRRRADRRGVGRRPALLHQTGLRRHRDSGRPGPEATPSNAASVPVVAEARVNAACLRVINQAQDVYRIISGIDDAAADVDLQRLDDIVAPAAHRTATGPRSAGLPGSTPKSTPTRRARRLTRADRPGAHRRSQLEISETTKTADTAYPWCSGRSPTPGRRPLPGSAARHRPPWSEARRAQEVAIESSAGPG